MIKEINFLLLCCRSKTQKRGDDKERRKRSPSPKPTKIHLGRLTRNVTKVCLEWRFFRSRVCKRAQIRLIRICSKVVICNTVLYFAQDHIQEIFSTYGKVKSVEVPMDRLHPHLSRCSAYVEFETPEEAQKALKYMDGGRASTQMHVCSWFRNFSLTACEIVTLTVIFSPWMIAEAHFLLFGLISFYYRILLNILWFFFSLLSGQIDGQEITASAVLTQRVRPPPRRLSPPRRMPPPPPMWRRSPPRMRRRYVDQGWV